MVADQAAYRSGQRATPVPAEVIEAIRLARSKIKSIKRDEFNPHDKYNYVSIDTYYEKVASIATEAGLVWRAREKSFELIENQGGRKDRTYVRSTLVYDTFCGGASSMDHMEITVLLPLIGAQTTGQLYSYADKVFLRTTLCVPTGEKDADAEGQDEFLSPIGRKTNLVAAGDGTVGDILARQPGSPTTTSIIPSGGSFDPLKGDDIPDFLNRPAPGSEPLHDSDGVFPVVDTKLFPSFADGLPIGKVDAIDAKGIGIIEEVFKVFMPLVKTQKALTQWHTDNVPTLDVVEKIDPNAYLRIKSMLRVRFDELNKKG